MLSEGFKKYTEETYDELIELLYTICRIPAPSHHEEKRAEFCLNWLKKYGMESAYIDSALNVIWKYDGGATGKATVMCAHTDTVFPETEPFEVKVDGNIASCPGIGDDTANLVVLMMVMRYIAKTQPKLTKPFIFVCNSCEEGLGNLDGTKQLFKDYAGQIDEFITLDGGMSTIVGHAVGSKRYSVSLDTEGGHSFGAFGNRNAIEKLAKMIEKLYAIEAPKREGTKTTYNVGGISGGTSVNTIAQHAEMLYEYRSTEPEFLEYMDKEFKRVQDEMQSECTKLEVKVLGIRPCGITKKEDEQPLFDRAAAVITEFTGKEPPMRSGSTDANIPLSLGIPAICFGACSEKGAHTYQESLDLNSFKTGYPLIAALLETYYA